MANRYWVTGGNGNTNSTTNWSDASGGAAGFSVPTSSDNAIWDVNSGSGTSTVNALLSCLSINCTGFTGTLTGSSNINVSGSVTFDAGMTLSCTGLLTISGAATLNWGGKTWGGAMTWTTAGIRTLLSDITITGTFTNNSGGGTITANGLFNINVGGSLVMTSLIVGTSTIVINGTGTWSGAGQVSCNLTINTVGTLTLSGTVIYASNTFLYTLGTVVTTGSTLRMNTGTYDVSTITFDNIIVVATSVLTSDLNLTGTLTYAAGSAYSLTGSNINCSGSVVYNSGAICTGTTTLNFTGTGTWTNPGNGNISHPVVINTDGIITISGTVKFGGSSLTYRRGKVIAGTATLNIASSCTLINIHKIVFGYVTIVGGQLINMNEFFSGSANIRTRISSTNTTNYIVTFQDGFEKISKFVRISNTTITNRLQLLVITDKANANTAGAVNLGVRYNNTVPNGISKSNPSANSPACFGIDDGFCAEPLSK